MTAEITHRKLDWFCKSGALTIQNGFACGDWNNQGRGILQIRPFNINNTGQLVFDAAKHIETDRRIDAYVLRRRDVIFNNTNSEELVGKVAIWNRTDRAVLSNHMTILRVTDEQKLNPEFLSFFLLTRWFDRYFHAVCRRHVNQASVSIDRLQDTDVPDFEISEQRTIARVLGLVQRGMEQQERLIEKTAELKKSLLHQLFTQGVRGGPQKQTEIGLVPAGWKLIPLGKLAKVGKLANVGQQGDWLRRGLDQSEFVGHGIRFIGTPPATGKGRGYLFSHSCVSQARLSSSLREHRFDGCQCISL